MKTTTISQDAENFLTALLWAYPEDDNGENPMDEKTVYDFSPEFITAVSNFCEAFRGYLYPILSDEQFAAIDDCPRSFGGNVYFSLSGHGVGFRDDSETEHLQTHLDTFSGDHYRFEGIDLSEDENGKLDLSYLPEFVAEYRRKMFTPAIATHSAFNTGN
jgi:hypothetical protein